MGELYANYSSIKILKQNKKTPGQGPNTDPTGYVPLRKLLVSGSLSIKEGWCDSTTYLGKEKWILNKVTHERALHNVLYMAEMQ